MGLKETFRHLLETRSSSGGGGDGVRGADFCLAAILDTPRSFLPRLAGSGSEIRKVLSTNGTPPPSPLQALSTASFPGWDEMGGRRGNLVSGCELPVASLTPSPRSPFIAVPSLTAETF